jgi:parallel beta-helix repeat protein
VRHTRIVGAVIALALSGLLAQISPAHAAHVRCGQVITQSTTLDSDVGPCSNNGIIIGADNITLDLNGRRVFGTAGPGDRAGVYVFRRSGVTVRNGTVSNFDGGVVIEGGSNNTVANVVARDNIGRGTGAQRTIYGDGIAILSSVDNRVLNNRAINNGPFAGIGVYSLVDADHPRQTTGVSSGNLLEGNQISDNIRARDGSLNNPEAAGVRFEPGGSRNTARNNQMVRNGIDGIQIFSGGGEHVVENNLIHGNGFFRTAARRGNGITLFRGNANNVIRNNRITRNADSGIWVQGPAGANPGSVGNRIVDNYAVGNVALPTIVNVNFAPHFDLNDRNPDCDANVWSGNRYRTANPPCTTAGGQRL